MKHHKSVELFSIFQCEAPQHKRSPPPHLRISGDGSEELYNQELMQKGWLALQWL